jgi:hypothetical protein
MPLPIVAPRVQPAPAPLTLRRRGARRSSARAARRAARNALLARAPAAALLRSARRVAHPSLRRARHRLPPAPRRAPLSARNQAAAGNDTTQQTNRNDTARRTLGCAEPRALHAASLWRGLSVRTTGRKTRRANNTPDERQPCTRGEGSPLCSSPHIARASRRYRPNRPTKGYVLYVTPLCTR